MLRIVLLSLLLMSAVEFSTPSVALGSQSAAARGEWTADTRSTWRDDDGEPRVQFNLRTGAGDSRWGFGVRLRDLAGLPSAAIHLVRMRIHKVDAMFVRHAREDGLAVTTPGEAVDLAIHGPRFRRRQ